MTYHISHSESFFRPASNKSFVVCKLSLRDPSSELLTQEILLLRDCIALSRKQWGFEILAAAILPSQLQMLAVFDTGEFGIKQAMAIVQKTFEEHSSHEGPPLWDGPADVSTLDPSAVPLRSAFIEAAPVRAGLVARPKDWRFSTAYRKEQGPDQTDMNTAYAAKAAAFQVLERQ